jgi:hypothetical protein
MSTHPADIRTEHDVTGDGDPTVSDTYDPAYLIRTGSRVSA